MADPLRTFLAERADALVRENFTGVRAEWWWERRIDGGIEICQELDPELMSREISERTGVDQAEVRRAVSSELGLEDPEPVVLTFEVSGETAEEPAARLLAERSSAPLGLAAGLYRQVEGAIEADRGPSR